MKRLIPILLMIVLPAAPGRTSWNTELTDVIRWSGYYYDLAAADGYLFAACQRGVEIYSLADPENPAPVGSFLTSGLANGLAVNLPYLYVGDVYGFSVWDVSDPAEPVQLGGFKRESQEGYQERLIYRDGFVFVAAYTSGLQVIDVSDPSAPFIASQFDTAAYAYDLGLRNNTVFVMDTFSMAIMDVSRPLYPVQITTYPAMFAGGIALDGDLAYLAFIDGLLILDVSDPYSPQILANIGPTGSGVAEAITMMENGYLAVTHQSYVELYDVSDPTDPIQTGFFYPPGHARKLLSCGDYLYTAMDGAGFHVADIRDPYHPIPIRQVNPSTWGSRQDVMMHEGFLYLCDNNRGLVIYEPAPDGRLTEIASYSAPGNTNDISFDGDRAYLACYTELQILDISDPSAPLYLGSYKTTGNIWHADPHGNRAYICDLYSFQVLDVSNPADVQRIGALYMSNDGTPYRSLVRHNTAYVATGWGGLKILDISTPEHPVLASEYASSDGVSYSTLLYHNNLLFLLDTGTGAEILDISDPLSPQLITTASVDDTVVPDIHLQDNTLFLAGSRRGIYIFDISQPANPRLRGWGDTPGDAVGITASDTHLYVADDYDLCIFDRQPLTPDTGHPQVSLLAPSSGAKLPEKTLFVHGTAYDPDSGIRYVEVTVDGGNSWHKAKGQDVWSYQISGLTPGWIDLAARAVDWAGNVGSPSPVRQVYLNTQQPRILLAGFNSTRIEGTGTRHVTVSALVDDPFSLRYIDQIELFLDGVALELTLDLVTIASGMALYSAEFDIEAGSPESRLYALIGEDLFGNHSAVWPYLTVRE